MDKEDDDLKLNLEETEIFSNSSTKDLNKYIKSNKRNNLGLKAKQKTIKYTNVYLCPKRLEFIPRYTP